MERNDKIKIFQQQILEWLEVTELTPKKLAKIADISHAKLVKYINGEVCPQSTTMSMLRRTIKNYRLEELGLTEEELKDMIIDLEEDILCLQESVEYYKSILESL